jgi:hypothetical protein
MMAFTSTRAGLPLLALGVACGLRPGTAAAQDSVTAAELHQIACYVLEVPEVRAAFDRGAPPLLVVSGRELGPLPRPTAPCPLRPSLPRGATEFRIIRPHTAPQFYGERGRNGAVLVDLPPARG